MPLLEFPPVVFFIPLIIIGAIRAFSVFLVLSMDLLTFLNDRVKKIRSKIKV
jgi:hypothetical protein